MAAPSEPNMLGTISSSSIELGGGGGEGRRSRQGAGKKPTTTAWRNKWKTGKQKQSSCFICWWKRRRHRCLAHCSCAWHALSSRSSAFSHACLFGHAHTAPATHLCTWHAYSLCTSLPLFLPHASAWQHLLMAHAHTAACTCHCVPAPATHRPLFATSFSHKNLPHAHSSCMHAATHTLIALSFSSSYHLNTCTRHLSLTRSAPATASVILTAAAHGCHSSLAWGWTDISPLWPLERRRTGWTGTISVISLWRTGAFYSDPGWRRRRRGG